MRQNAAEILCWSVRLQPGSKLQRCIVKLCRRGLKLTSNSDNQKRGFRVEASLNLSRNRQRTVAVAGGARRPAKYGKPPKERVKRNSGSVGEIGPGLKSTIVAAETKEQIAEETANAAKEAFLLIIRSTRFLRTSHQ